MRKNLTIESRDFVRRYLLMTSLVGKVTLSVLKK